MSGRHAKPPQRIKRLAVIAAFALIAPLAVAQPAETAPQSVSLPAYQSVSVSPDAATQPVIRDEFTVTQYYYASPVACDWHSVSDVGSRIAPLKGASSNHNGTDIVCNRVGDDTGTPLLSIANGVVVEVGNQRAGIGSYMVIQHWTNGESFYTRYGHMIRGSQTLGVGSPVSIGQQVGSMGSTGTSNGAHLHLEIHMNGSPSSTSAVDFFIARSALTLPKF